MKDQVQLATAVTPLRNNNKSPEQMMCIGRPPLKARVSVVITTLVLTATAAWAEPQGTWSSTGSMAIGRFVFTATTLQNGKVLVAGGDAPGDIITNKAELYDPTTGTFTQLELGKTAPHRAWWLISNKPAFKLYTNRHIQQRREKSYEKPNPTHNCNYSC